MDELEIFIRQLSRPQHKPLPAPEQIRLARLAQAGDTAARDRLVDSYLRLVLKLALHRSLPGVDTMDLVQGGCIGLLRAIEKFDADRGHYFSTYATPWIRQGVARTHSRRLLICIPDGVLQTTGGSGLPVAQSIGDEDKDYLSVITVDEPASQFAEAADRESAVRRAVARLPPRDREVVLARMAGQTLGEIGERQGVCRERIRQIEQRAHGSLAAWLKREVL